MIVRDATIEDVKALEEMAKKFYEYSEFEKIGLKYDRETVENLMTGLIHSGVLIVLEEDSIILGMIGGGDGPWMADKSQKVLMELFFYIDERARGKSAHRLLMNAFIKKGRVRGDQFVTVGTIPKREKAIQRMFSGFGFKHIESQLSMEVK